MRGNNYGYEIHLTTRFRFVFQDSTEYDEDLSTDGVGTRHTSSNEEEEELYVPTQVMYTVSQKSLDKTLSKSNFTTHF
jgi:hypothetical protein